MSALLAVQTQLELEEFCSLPGLSPLTPESIARHRPDANGCCDRFRQRGDGTLLFMVERHALARWTAPRLHRTLRRPWRWGSRRAS